MLISYHMGISQRTTVLKSEILKLWGYGSWLRHSPSTYHTAGSLGYIHIQGIVSQQELQYGTLQATLLDKCRIPPRINLDLLSSPSRKGPLCSLVNC